jgi:hypothetical protein
MFDPTMVINTARQGRYPSDWHVFPGKSRLGCTIGFALFLLCFGAAFSSVLGVIITGFLGFSSFRMGDPNITGLHIEGIGLVAALFAAGLFLSGAVWVVLRSLAEGRSLLVLLPEGVVECYQGKMGKIAPLSFSMVQKMNMDKQTTVRSNSEGHTSSSTNYWLNVYDGEGGYVKWNIRTCYGDPVVTGGNIIAAFEHYQRQQMQRG